MKSVSLQPICLLSLYICKCHICQSKKSVLLTSFTLMDEIIEEGLSTDATTVGRGRESGGGKAEL